MIPTRQELIFAYEQLQFQPALLIAKQIVQFAEWCRFDPRLAQLFVSFIGQNFMDYNPLEIRQFNQKTKNSQTLSALLDIAEIQLSENQEIRIEWKLWKKCIQANIQPAPQQAFYIALTAINPNRQLQQLKKNLKYFSKWGFYCDELPMTEKINKVSGTHMPKAQRLEILKILLKEKKQITVNDYLVALNQKAHRRQAERDLEETQGLRRHGKTKGRIYVVKK